MLARLVTVILFPWLPHAPNTVIWHCCVVSPSQSRVTVDLLDFFKTRVQSSLQSHSVTSDFITQDIQGYAVWLSPDNTDKSSLSPSLFPKHIVQRHTPITRHLEGSHVALVYTHTHAQWKPKPLTVNNPPPPGSTANTAHGGGIVSMRDL